MRDWTGKAMNTRWLAALLLWAWSLSAAAAVIDLRIYDAFGSAYPTTQLGKQLGAQYNLDFQITMVLILGPSLQDAQVLEQEDIVAALEPERHGILFAVGTPTQTYTRGFSITPNDAARLLPSEDGFRVLVLGPNGRVLHDSDSIVSREKLLQVAPGG